MLKIFDNELEVYLYPKSSGWWGCYFAK